MESLTRIRELPEVLRNQIAAGEVVERPASVVKELVENALDAGAREIRVDLEEGGAKLVRITDDGSGMGSVDLELAFAPHATSKLHDLADLDHISSLGFRGEALASIGSVARCRLLSRPEGDATGFCVHNEGGVVSGVEEAGARRGTVIEVRDLFYNTPARRRFLRAPRTELSRILDVLQRLALAQPEVGFTATHDGKRVLEIDAAMDLRGRVRRLFGAELAEALVPFDSTEAARRGTPPPSGAQLRGLVAPPRFSRRDTSRQMWFLNGRPLKDRVLSRVLKEGYRGFLEDGRQPTAFLQLSLDPAAVDVNVHPTKSEVRFRDERPLFGYLVSVLREAVARTDIATPGDRLLDSAARRGAWAPRKDAPGQSWLPASGTDRAETSTGSGPARFADPAGTPGSTGQVSEPGGATYELPRPTTGNAPLPVGSEHGGQPGWSDAQAPGSEAWAATDDLRGPFLQIDKTYLVRALPDGFEVIDQHALHERLTFEALRVELREGRVEVQRMLVPELVEVSRAEVKLCEQNAPGLARLGIEIEPFGPTTIAVQGLPAQLRRPNAEGVLRDVLEVLSATGTLPDAEDVLEDVLHRTACRSSIMAGDELTEDAIRALLVRGRELESDQTCPHARPTRVRFRLDDLEKAFHRR